MGYKILLLIVIVVCASQLCYGWEEPTGTVGVCNKTITTTGYYWKNESYWCYKRVPSVCRWKRGAGWSNRRRYQCYTYRAETCYKRRWVCGPITKTVRHCCDGYEQTPQNTCRKKIDCGVKNGGCEQVCMMKNGMHSCMCIPGYEMDGPSKCKNVNECEKNNGGCDHMCTDSEGSFVCSCRRGYELVNSKKCNDVDECEIGNGGCQHTCTNNVGSFSCSCRNGFIKNETTCTDRNECSVNNGGCAHGCVNTEGSYECICKPGYELAADKHTCTNVNECSQNKGGCQHSCKDTEGSYKCSCPSGYQLHQDKHNCTDIDECTVNNGGCAQICVDKEGSHECKCQRGFILKNNAECEDINECQDENGGCMQICKNQVGGHTCSCNAGYKLKSDGYKCEKEDNLKPGNKTKEQQVGGSGSGNGAGGGNGNGNGSSGAAANVGAIVGGLIGGLLVLLLIILVIILARRYGDKLAAIAKSKKKQESDYESPESGFSKVAFDNNLYGTVPVPILTSNSVALPCKGKKGPKIGSDDVVEVDTEHPKSNEHHYEDPASHLIENIAYSNNIYDNGGGLRNSDVMAAKVDNPYDNLGDTGAATETSAGDEDNHYEAFPSQDTEGLGYTNNAYDSEIGQTPPPVPATTEPENHYQNTDDMRDTEIGQTPPSVPATTEPENHYQNTDDMRAAEQASYDNKTYDATLP